MMVTGFGTAGNAGDSGRPSGQKAAVPAYWAPQTPAGEAAFELLAQGTPTVDMAIMNGPADGPPTPFHLETAHAIEKLRKSGVTVLGYVDTGYLGRTGQVTTRVKAGSTDIADWQAQARQDVAAWYSLYGRYGVTGIFFDQAPSSRGPDDSFLDAYGRLASVVWENHDGFVGLNPGADTEECYTRVANALVIFENTYAVYQKWTPQAWVSRYPAGRFWHLLHAVPTQAEMRRAVALSKERRAGFVYVTNDTIDETGSPWNRLPPLAYWEDELRQISHDHRS